LGGGSDIVSSSVARKGSRYFDYGFMPLHPAFIIEDARSKMVNSPLTLIFRSTLRYYQKHLFS